MALTMQDVEQMSNRLVEVSTIIVVTQWRIAVTVGALAFIFADQRQPAARVSRNLQIDLHTQIPFHCSLLVTRHPKPRR